MQSMSRYEHTHARDLALVTDDGGNLEPYAWPGGHDIAYYVADAGMICVTCANENRDADDPQWNVIAFDVTSWWDDAEACDHCARLVGPSDE